jgi:hypothetical protein
MFLYCLLPQAVAHGGDRRSIAENSLPIHLLHDSLPIHFLHDLARIEPHDGPPSLVVLRDDSTGHV